MNAGTTRLQLKDKGDNGQMTDFANIIVAFAFLGVPVIGWLLDKKVCVGHVASKCMKHFRFNAAARLTQRVGCLCVAGLRHHAGHHQWAEPLEQHPSGHS